LSKPTLDTEKKTENQHKLLLDLLKNSFIFKTVDSDD
jgi:cAMP-dependent protein kinase regulator